MSSQAPQSLTLHRKTAVLEVAFADTCFQLPAEYLRVFSPSAEVRGHGRENLQLDKQNVAITAIEPQGNYAVRLSFSDGHSSGIYSWSYLRELGEQQRENWAHYLDKVAAHRAAANNKAGAASAVKWVEPKPKKN